MFAGSLVLAHTVQTEIMSYTRHALGWKSKIYNMIEKAAHKGTLSNMSVVRKAQ